MQGPKSPDPSELWHGFSYAQQMASRRQEKQLPQMEGAAHPVVQAIHQSTKSPPQPQPEKSDSKKIDLLIKRAEAMNRLKYRHASFRFVQGEVIRDIFGGDDVVALMPTGGGKSLCYELPALVLPGITVVISPLLALMENQCDQLRSRGVRAAVLSSLQPEQTQQAVMAELHRSKPTLKVLYVTPERIVQSVSTWTALVRLYARGKLPSLPMLYVPLTCRPSGMLALFAIDEAHCMSQWGHDFRPEYAQLGKLKAHMTRVPIIAATATATAKVVSEIKRLLRIPHAKVHQTSFNRYATYFVVDC